MIDDHKSSVESACETARDILAHTDDPREKRLVSSDVDRLMTHWNAINTTAASQLAAVEAALAASNDYLSKADPFCEWLDTAEKKAAGLDLPTADTSAIEQQIALQRVIVSAVSELSSLISIEHSLSLLLSIISFIIIG